jgi:ABC-type tungstate transport system permease subunit
VWRISYIRADYAKIDFLSRADKAAQAEASSIVSLWKNANIKSKQRLWKSQ